MKSKEILSLVKEMRCSAKALKASQYSNSTYPRYGGNNACDDFEKYASILEAYALDLVRKEAVEEALSQLPLTQTIVIKI